MRAPLLSPILVLTAVLALPGCGKAPESETPRKGPPATPVNVAPVSTAAVTVTERVLGRVESAISPQLDAEVPGTVTRVLVDVGDRVTRGQLLAELDTTDLKIALDGAHAEVGRLEALRANQQRTVQRFERLYQDKTISEGTLEEAQSQLKALSEQLASARAQLARAERGLLKSRIHAPVDGAIEARRVAPGDYVDAKAVLFLLASEAQLRVHLPFPETLAARVKPGLKVLLHSPLAPEQKVQARITAVRPTVSAANRAMEAIVTLPNPGGWTAGASVSAEVILEEHDEALMVPDLSVVRRPAGEVVYVIKGETAQQRVVTTGVRRDGMVEILSGLGAEDQVVTDGAGFLTVQARVAPRN